jgi:hypothetical protein
MLSKEVQGLIMISQTFREGIPVQMGLKLTIWGLISVSEYPDEHDLFYCKKQKLLLPKYQDD